jgi:hypothetical protein
MPDRAAERLIADRYALETSIGRGGMGIVWRARDTLLGREVAIKEVRVPPTVPDSERDSMRARVLREARAAARLNHPGAVTLYDVINEQGHAFIVMELIHAPTLAEVVASEGPLDPGRAASVGLQVAAALAGMGLARTASDQLVAAHLLRAGLEGGLATVAFNLRRIPDGAARDGLLARSERLEATRRAAGELVERLAGMFP